MSIKIKYKDPKSTDFGPNDLVINVKEGTIFYKSEKGLFKLQGDNLNTTIDLIDFDSDISAFKGIFKGIPGIGEMRIGVEGIRPDRFTVQDSLPTIESKGHIIPTTSRIPMYDLGSITNPWRDIYFSPDSLHFVKTARGVGNSKIGTTFKLGNYGLETISESTTLSKTDIDDLKEGKSITSQSLTLSTTGDVEAVLGVTNYIRPEVIYHPTDNESALIHKTAGRLHYRSAGGDPFEIYADGGSNDYIRLGSTTTGTTEIKLHGSISASIDGGSF